MNIAYDDRVRQGMLAGIDKLANTIRGTLGPNGRNVAMYQKQNLRGAEYTDRAQSGAQVLITNDGATIARSIVLPDRFEDMGVRLLREVSIKTNETAGDGTTTAAVLTQSILHDTFKSLSAGACPVALRRGLAQAGERAVQMLGERARPITAKEDIARVAAVSCQDRELGDMVGEALYAVGLDGVISIDDSKKNETTLEILEGIVFEKGFQSPIMATDKEQTVAELHDPYILICDTKFTAPQELLPFLIIAAEDERSCLIISDGVEGEAMGLILKNKTEGDMDIVCVTAPLYGEGRRWRMEDMAVQTGAAFITKELGMDARRVTRDMLGTASSVKATRSQTVITGAGGDPEAVQNKINEIRSLISHSDYQFNRERYQERLAKFVSGVAKINVGGGSDAEIQERKLRVEDAVNAARAAAAEGVVAGGGAALLGLVQELRTYAAALEGDERTGALALVNALKAPARQIAENSGIDGGTVVERLLSERPGTGYDAEKEMFVDMLDAGIVDPVKVTRLALECALSVSSTLLTTGAGMTGEKNAADSGKETA